MKVTRFKLRPSLELDVRRPIEAVPAMADGVSLASDELLDCKAKAAGAEGGLAHTPSEVADGVADSAPESDAPAEMIAPTATGRWNAERGRRRRKRGGGAVPAAADSPGDAGDAAAGEPPGSLMDRFDGIQ